MSVITWDGTGEKLYELGVKHGVLYPLNTANGLYDSGVAWNGLTAVNEKPAGASQNASYADNIKYLSLTSLETFGGTIEAYTYPDEFLEMDGVVFPSAGVGVAQQDRKTFGLCYRTEKGSDVNSGLGFKLHLVYGAKAAPSEKDYTTVNDSPAPVQFSWDFECIPVNVTTLGPTSIITIDSTEVDSDSLTTLTNFLYGTGGTEPSLPSPDDVIAIFGGDLTKITLTPATFNGAHTITIPTQTGTKYYVDGVEHAAGSVTLTTGQSKVVSARAQTGYAYNTPVVTEWLFTFVS